MATPSQTNACRSRAAAAVIVETFGGHVRRRQVCVRFALMWGEQVKGRALELLTRLSRHASPERISVVAGRVERLRTLIEEGMEAVWHFGAIPSKRDVRLLERQVASLRRRVRTLDGALADIERRARQKHKVSSRQD